MTEEFGVISTFGGRTPSPALDGDYVYVAGVAFGWADNAGPAYRIFCFDNLCAHTTLIGQKAATIISEGSTRRGQLLL